MSLIYVSILCLLKYLKLGVVSLNLHLKQQNHPHFALFKEISDVPWTTVIPKDSFWSKQ